MKKTVKKIKKLVKKVSVKPIRSIKRNSKGQLLKGCGALNPKGGGAKDKSYSNKPIMRTSQGKLMTGSGSLNPRGRKKGDTFMDEFRLAMRTVQRRKRKSLLEHFLEKAYSDNRVLIACVDRILPALKSVEVYGSVGTMDEETAKTIQDKLKKRFA